MLNYRAMEVANKSAFQEKTDVVKKWVKKNWLMSLMYFFAFYGMVSFLTDIGINELYMP